MRELWYRIPGFPNYEITKKGCVKRLHCAYGNYPPNKIITDNNGQVFIKDGDRYRNVAIAALMLLTFRGPPPSPEQNIARHLDDVKSNYAIRNLAWGTRFDNMQDAIRNGRQGKGSPARIRAANAIRGIPRPASVRKKISNKLKGRVITDEWKAKISKGVNRAIAEGRKKS